MAEEQTHDRLNEGTPPPGEREPPVTEKQAEGVAGPDERGQRPAKESQTVAEEQTHDRPSEGTPPPGKREPPVTEKPVVTRRKISRYVVSIDDATGAIVKMEKLDEKTGEPKELTQEEYAMAYAFASYAAPYYAVHAASLYDPLSNPAVQAYLKAISDYWRVLTTGR